MSKFINNSSLNVFLMVDENCEVSFTVNNSMTIADDCPNKYTITKWLLEQFNLLKVEYDMLSCRAYHCDGKGEYRATIYQKKGFLHKRGNPPPW